MNAEEEKHDNRLRLVEDHIGRSLSGSENTGVVPPEIEMMHNIEALRQSIERAGPQGASEADIRRLSDLRQQLAIRLERLRSTA